MQHTHLPILALLAASLALVPTSTASHGIEVIDDEAAVFAGHPAAEHTNVNAQVAGETIYMKATYGVTVTQDGSRLAVTVEYDTRFVVGLPHHGVCDKTADLDAYVYGPTGEVLHSDTGCDLGELIVGKNDMSPGQYEVVVVGTHGVSLDYTAEGTLYPPA